MEPKVAFGRVVRRRRIDIGLTQEQLGFEADLRRTYVSMIELGQQQPSLSTIFKLAKGLRGGVPPSGVRAEGVGFAVVALQGHHGGRDREVIGELR